VGFCSTGLFVQLRQIALISAFLYNLPNKFCKVQGNGRYLCNDLLSVTKAFPSLQAMPESLVLFVHRGIIIHSKAVQNVQKYRNH
jgi:hypothetical protein